jgi:hypothetical protein
VDAFALGYNQVLARGAGEPGLWLVPDALRGFAVEGAAMSAALLDLLTFSGGARLARLEQGYGRRYVHLVHVGAGWAFARLHRRPWRGIRGAQPLLRWLAWDGWGFHQAFFGAQRVFARQRTEPAARGDLRAIRDQGAGRALWFYAGADPGRIAGTVRGFTPERRCDLWAGIGLAASYTGAQPPEVLEDLLRVAGDHRPHLGQGAAFAAKAHVLSGAVPPPAGAAIEVLTGVPPAVAAEWTDACLAVAAREGDSPVAYQKWRAGIRGAWIRHNEGVPL